MKEYKKQLTYNPVCKMVFSLKHLYKGFFNTREIDYSRKDIIFYWIESLSIVMETEEYEKFFSSLTALTQLNNYLLIEYDYNNFTESKDSFFKSSNLKNIKTNKLILDLKEEKVVI